MNTIQLWMIATGVAISVMTSAVSTTDGGNSDTRLTFKTYHLNAGCSLLSLASNFPHLYPNRSDITRPGVPGAFDADVYLNTSTFRLAINLTFNAPVIGNLSSFKGFEIIYHRSDNLSISCWIFDLSDINFTAANIKTLFNFAVQPAKKNSTYFFEISTLPKPAMLSEPSGTLTMNVFVLNSTAGTDASNWTTYVKFTNDSQKKEVWVEFTEPPASFNFSKFEVKLFPQDKDGEIQNATISGVNHTFSDVKPGLYTIMIKPYDVFTNPVLCKCCKNSVYQQCTTSETTPFYIRKVEQISTKSQLSSTATTISSTMSRPVSTVSTDMFQPSSSNVPTTIQMSTTPRIFTNSISVGFHRTTLTISSDRTLVSNGTMSESTASSSYHGISTKLDISSAVPSNQGDMTFTYVIIGCASGVILAVLVVTVHCLRHRGRQDLIGSKPDPSKKENKMHQGNGVDDDLNSVVMLDAILKIKSSKTLKEHADPFSRKNVFLVFAEDHDDHIKAVDLFASFLQSHCFCDVVYAPYHVESLQKDGLITRMHYSLEKADCILIINSASLYTIYNAEKCRKKLRSRSDTSFANILMITIKFVMSKLAENPNCRIANLRFEHTPNEYVVSNLSESFLLLKQFKELLYYIHEIKEREDTKNNFEHLEIATLLKTDNWQFLCNAIQSAWLFEQKNPNWLSQRFCAEECDFIGYKEVILKEGGKCLSDTILDVQDILLDSQTRESRMVGTDLSSPEDSSVKNPNGFYCSLNKTDRSLSNALIPLYTPPDIEEDKHSKTFSEQMTSINEHYNRRREYLYGNTIRTSRGEEEVKENRQCTPIDNYCALGEANSSSPDDFIPPDDFFPEDVISNGSETHMGILCNGFQGNMYGCSEIRDLREKEWRQTEDDNVSLGGYSV